MRKLAGIETKDDDIFFELNKLIKHYNIWIKEKEEEAKKLKQYKETAKKHISECKECLSRMQAGIDFLKSDSKALEAFKLSNHAILIQQFRHTGNTRNIKITENPIGSNITRTAEIPNTIKSSVTKIINDKKKALTNLSTSLVTF